MLFSLLTRKHIIWDEREPFKCNYETSKMSTDLYNVIKIFVDKKEWTRAMTNVRL